MRTISIWVCVLLGLGASGLGCKPPYPRCRESKGDADCANYYQLCVDGTCMECRSDDDCNTEDEHYCIMNACMREDLRPERVPPVGPQK